jgi:hypothetical protein
MNTNNQPLVVAKGPSTLARARFGPGMLLQHDDLEQLNLYTRELSRLIFSSLFGCGVICGLVVSAKMDCGKVTVSVAPGLALDCQGDPIHVPQRQNLVLDPDCDSDLPARLWVVLCGTGKCCAPRTSMCASDEDESPSVCTRERDWFEIRIVRTRPLCTCACPEPDAKGMAQDLPENTCWCVNPAHPCYAAHYAGKCGCDCGDCANCDCDCVLLARLDKEKDGAGQVVWMPDHKVRRFVRPVLMRDPQVWQEEQAPQNKDKKGEQDRADGKAAAATSAMSAPEGAQAEPGDAAATAAPGRPDTDTLKRTRRREHG